MNTIEFKTRLKTQGYQETATVSRGSNYSLGEHTHPFDVCALILEDSIRLQVNNVDTVYHVGDVFELARDTPHYEWAGEHDVTCLAGRIT
jgi:quercetin dioxygenase-like cupin family protein